MVLPYNLQPAAHKWCILTTYHSQHRNDASLQLMTHSGRKLVPMLE